MIIPRLPRIMLKTKISLYRLNKKSLDEVGAVKTEHETILSGIYAHIQSDGGQHEYSVSGKRYIATHEIQFDKYVGGESRDVKNGDIVYNHETGERYIVIDVRQEYSNLSKTGYYDLSLKFLGNDSRYSIVQKGTFRTRARIKTDPGIQKLLDIKANIENG